MHTLISTFFILLPLTSAFAGPIDDRKLVPAAMAAFREGSIEHASHPKDKVDNRCKDFKNWFRLFCVEGFYLAAHLERFGHLTGDGAAIKTRLADLPAETELRPPFLRSLGFAISQLEQNPQKFWPAFDTLSEGEKLYVIDGWASGQYPRYGYEVVRRDCQQATSDALRAACFWGMGRAFFFSGIPAGNSPFYEETFIGGYAFARAMANPEILPPSEMAKIKLKSAKAAETYKHMFTKSSAAGPDSAKLSACLKGKHFTQCVTAL